MFNKNLVRKVGWLVTTSSLGLSLVAPLHAGEVRTQAQTETQLAIAKVKDAQSKLDKFVMSPEEALAKGLKLMERATTPKQHVVAFEYINYAAKQGLAEAQFQCAIMYLDNQYVPADDARAMSLLEKASAQGHKQAGIALNYIQYADGGIGC